MSREVHDASVVQSGYEQPSVTSGAVVTLNATQYAGATKAVIQTNQTIRYMLDHAAGGLTTAKGLRQTSTDALLVVPAKNFALFGMIAESTTANVEVMYIREQA